MPLAIRESRQGQPSLTSPFGKMGFSPHVNQTMKTMTKACIPVLLSSVLFVGCASTPTAWEYKSLQTFVYNDLDQKLNKLAAEGWTVVSSSTSQNQADSPFAVVILKRPKR
jgi:hypothetical protein